MKVIFSGLESSGKSLRLAMTVAKIARRNAKWFKQTGISRPILSNMPFNKDFEDYVVQELGVPIIYWQNIDELITYENCDVIIDEVANYFDARNWEQLPLDARMWLSQGAKRGIELYGSAQDFAQVDKAFRRLVNHLLHIKKVIGSRRPSATTLPVKRIWGACLLLELDPQTYKEDKDKFAHKSILGFRLFLIQRRFCDIFDTTAKIVRSAPPKMKHIERFCELEDCRAVGHHRIQHV